MLNCSGEVNFGWILSKLGKRAKNCFLLTALLLESLASSLTRVFSILKKKNDKKTAKNTAVLPLNFSTLVVW